MISFLPFALLSLLVPSTVTSSAPLQTPSHELIGTTTGSLICEVYGPTPESGDRVEFGWYIDWNDIYLAVGAPQHGSNGGGAIFVYRHHLGDDHHHNNNSNNKKQHKGDMMNPDWSLFGGLPDEGIGGKFGLGGKWIAVRHKEHVEVHDMESNTLVGAPIESVNGQQVSLSPTKTLVVSEERFNSNQGRIRILNLEGGHWTTKFELIGFEGRSYFGWETDISADGNRVVISAPNTGKKRGSVLVVERDGSSDRWASIGQLLNGAADDCQFGYSVNMSGDGSTVIVGSPGRLDGAGSAIVYRYNDGSGSWEQIGSEIIGMTPLRLGRTVSISHDGNRIAVGSFAYNMARGFVGIHDYIDDDWILTHESHGSEIRQRLGHSAVLSSDGKRLATGSSWALNDNDEVSGKVQVFDFDESVDDEEGFEEVTESSNSSETTSGGVGVAAMSLVSTLYGSTRSDEKSSEFGRVAQLSANGWLLVGAPAEESLGAFHLFDSKTLSHVWSKTGEEVGGEIGSCGAVSTDGGDGSRVAVCVEGTVIVYDIHHDHHHHGGGDDDDDSFDSLVGVPIRSKGEEVALSSDGSVLAVAEQSFNQFTGRVFIFSFQPGQGWIETGMVEGDQSRGRFGYAMSFSDSGHRLAVAAPQYDAEGTVRRGLVRIYENDGDEWSQVGQDVLGPNNDRSQFGLCLALSGDGESLVVGIPNDGIGDVANGAVVVLKLLDGSWEQIGNRISGEDNLNRFGQSVSISPNGVRIAATSLFYSGQRGQARVFDFDGSDWMLVHEIEGKEKGERVGAGRLGASLSKDGLLLAVGATQGLNQDDDKSGKVLLSELPHLDEESITVLTSMPTVFVTTTSSPVAPTSAAIVHSGPQGPSYLRPVQSPVQVGGSGVEGDSCLDGESTSGCVGQRGMLSMLIIVVWLFVPTVLML